MSAREGMTAGDLRAEADRIAKAHGQEYAAGVEAGFRNAIAQLEAWRRELDPRYSATLIESLDLAIDNLNECVPHECIPADAPEVSR